jgi:CheY-like chemotaxis protein
MGGDKKNLPIIAITANIDSQEREHCFQVGMNDFIGKPIRSEELYRVLVRWMNGE